MASNKTIRNGGRTLRTVAFIPCRNEERTLSKVLDSMMNQSLPFSEIIVINDGSTDRTKEIALQYDIFLIDLPEKHESYVGKPEMANIFNHAIDYIQRFFPCDYIMQIGSDALIPHNYNEEMTKRMDFDKNLVIAGGVIEGEPQYESHVRGNGRYYDSKFWFKYIRLYPINYTWESYPLYYASALGFEVRNYPDLIMIPLRSTKYYKDLYGHAMRELGYFPPYVLGKCLLSFIMNQREGIKMFISYVKSPYRCPKRSPYYEMKNYLRFHQIQRIRHIQESINIWLKRR